MNVNKTLNQQEEVSSIKTWKLGSTSIHFCLPTKKLIKFKNPKNDNKTNNINNELNQKLQ